MSSRQMHIGMALGASWKKGSDTHSDAQAKGTPIEEAPEGLDLYVWQAKLAEKAKLDFVFRADYLFLHPRMVRNPAEPEGLDPTLMMASIARETERIGLVTTMSTTFNPPYVVARQMLTLHWLSQGRAGWNIVTSIEGAENFGMDAMPQPAERYRRAAEFTDVVKQLWASYSPKTVAEGQGMPAAINHAGEFYRVKGPLNVTAYPGGTPPLFQAGASDIGRHFASSIANAVFAASPDVENGLELRTDLRQRAIAHGRDANEIRVLPGLYFFLGKTREEALDMHRQAHANITLEQRYDAMKSVSGLDVRGLALDSILTEAMLPDASVPVRSFTHAQLLRHYIRTHQPTVETVLSRPEVIGSAHWVAVGTVDDVLAEIMARFDAGAMDGFIAIPGGAITSLHLFIDELIPALVKKGVFRSEYEGRTLRDHLRIATA